MIVLRRRLEAVIHEMINALARSGRSGVINTALDFSCSITDYKLQSISTALGLSVHVGAIHLIPKAIVEKFGTNIREGDCFANNSGYHGNTHCGDLTLCSPVFYDGELVFFSIARAHLGDMGFPTPTTYAPLAKDCFEEGLTIPCIRNQQNFQDLPDVIDLFKANVRASDQFYGDYLATLAAVRTGERRIKELCAKYGAATIKSFLDQYQTYAEAMAIAAIRKLPKAHIRKETFHDSQTPLYPGGIPVRATLEIDPEAAMVTIDLSDNIDNLPLGINLTESTVTACCVTAVLNILGPDVPRCTGSFRRIKLLLREGSAVGIPRFPAATSSATTNLAHVLTPLIQSMFADLRAGLGTAFGSIGLPASAPVVSGTDWRNEGREFVNQIIMGYWGGPALNGHDGWVTYGSGSSQGILWQSSVEVVEQQQPVLVEYLEAGKNSGGAGEWEGGPGASCAFRSRSTPVRFLVSTAGRDFPPAGVRGGGSGRRSMAWKVAADGSRSELPIAFDVTLNEGEMLVSEGCGGGGYGDPLRRDQEKVRASFAEEHISMERARDVYGVVLNVSSDEVIVDAAATSALRTKLRNAAST